jgi:hypothetical protein
MGETWYAYKVLFGNLCGKRLLQKTRHSLDDSIKINLKEIGYINVIEQALIVVLWQTSFCDDS